MRRDVQVGNSYNAPKGLTAAHSANLVVTDFNGDKRNDIAAFNAVPFSNGHGTLQGNAANPQLAGTGGVTEDFNGRCRSTRGLRVRAARA